MGDITIRRSTSGDLGSIERLAQLDSSEAPHGAILLAFQGDELVAALPLDGGAPVADPFHYTREILDLLRLRAAQAEAPASWRRRHLKSIGLAYGSAA